MPSKSRPRILMIDDQPEQLSALVRLLEQYDFRVSQATSARVGFQRAQALRPDVILLDLYMPELDGFAVCRLLRESPLTEDIPVIFLSSSCSVDDRLNGFSLGAIDFVQKPYCAEEVLARIRINIYRRIIDDRHPPAQPSPAVIRQDDVILQAAIKLLKENLAHPPRVADLARSVGTHEKRLLRIFRIHLGTTITSYVRQARIEHARQLLSTDLISIEEIAAQVGFNNPGNFSTAFRKVEGISPRQYRQNCLRKTD